MSDNYQPIYDAVRSRIGSCDIERAAREAFDASFAIERIRVAFEEVAQSMGTPAALYCPRISIDGNKWCALYGDNLQEGVAGSARGHARIQHGVVRSIGTNVDCSPQGDAMNLNALVEKWQAQAAFFMADKAYRVGTIVGERSRVGAMHLRQCADELEAAIAGAGEAVAWMDHMGGVITAAMKNRDPGLPYNIPLFTHPADAVQVTELRKVAKRNLRSLITRSNDSEKELMLKCLEELS